MNLLITVLDLDLSSIKAMTDGLSVPKIFRWYLPDWNDKNILYNIAGICHDGMYGSELISKDIADLIFYNGLVKAGISKTKASAAKYAVQYLAGLHYGKNMMILEYHLIVI